MKIVIDFDANLVSVISDYPVTPGFIIRAPYGVKWRRFSGWITSVDGKVAVVLWIAGFQNALEIIGNYEEILKLAEREIKKWQ